MEESENLLTNKIYAITNVLAGIQSDRRSQTFSNPEKPPPKADIANQNANAAPWLLIVLVQNARFFKLLFKLR